MSTFVNTARRLLHLSSQRKIFSMNPLNAEVYELKGQIFRRNVPLEQISQLSAPSTSENIIALDDTDDADQEECNLVIESANKELPDECTSVNNEESGQESAELEKETTVFIKYDSAKKCYHTSFQVASSQIGSLVGFKGSTIQNLEKETKCTLAIDKSTSIIEVSSDSSNSVRMCKNKIQSLLNGVGSGKSTSPTHFVSVELSNEVLRKAYTELVENIRTDESIPEQCQEKSLFRPVEKLHLTISVLRLPTEEDKEVAKKCVEGVLQNKIREMLENEHQIPVQFDGLDFFGNGSSKANVVFAKIVSDKLQEIANAIDDALYKTGLAEKRKTEDVKLHLTLINTKNAKKGFKYRKINASALLRKFGDFKFDSVMVNEVRICSMHGVDPSTNGYQAIHSVKL